MFLLFRHTLATHPYDLAVGLRNSHLYGMNQSHSLFPVNPSARHSAHQEAFDGEIERSDGNEMQFHFLICIIARQPTYLRVLNACFFLFSSPMPLLMDANTTCSSTGVRHRAQTVFGWSKSGFSLIICWLFYAIFAAKLKFSYSVAAEGNHLNPGLKVSLRQ